MLRNIVLRTWNNLPLQFEINFKLKSLCYQIQRSTLCFISTNNQNPHLISSSKTQYNFALYTA